MEGRGAGPLKWGCSRVTWVEGWGRIVAGSWNWLFCDLVVGPAGMPGRAAAFLPCSSSLSTSGAAKLVIIEQSITGGGPTKG